MRALLAQLPSVLRDPAANARRAVQALAAHSEVTIAVFPELFLSAYDLRSLVQTARRPDCGELAEIAEAAAQYETAVVVGFAELNTDGGFSNSVACIDRDGTLAGVYRKTQLYADERKVFTPGRELTLVCLAGLIVGPLICFDIEFPEPARVLAVAGAELLVTVSANMDPYEADHELASRARALDNRIPHLYVNGVGVVGPLRLCGASRSIGPDGAVLASAGGAETLLVAPIGVAAHNDDVDYLRRLPEHLPVAAH
jgi:predicted amidohydrolase